MESIFKASYLYMVSYTVDIVLVIGECRHAYKFCAYECCWSTIFSYHECGSTFVYCSYVTLGCRGHLLIVTLCILGRCFQKRRFLCQTFYEGVVSLGLGYLLGVCICSKLPILFVCLTFGCMGWSKLTRGSYMLLMFLGWYREFWFSAWFEKLFALFMSFYVVICLCRFSLSDKVNCLSFGLHSGPSGKIGILRVFMTTFLGSFCSLPCINGLHAWIMFFLLMCEGLIFFSS